MFVRVDVVLGAHWLSDEELELVPMINEMDWLNSAGMLTHFWAQSPAPQASDSATDTVTDDLPDDVSDSTAAAGPSDASGGACSSISRSVEIGNRDVCQVHQKQSKAVQQSHGYKVAQTLYAEILQTWAR